MPLVSSIPDKMLGKSIWGVRGSRCLKLNTLLIQYPMASRSSSTVPRPGWNSPLRMRRRLTALGQP